MGQAMDPETVLSVKTIVVNTITMKYVFETNFNQAFQEVWYFEEMESYPLRFNK